MMRIAVCCVPLLCGSGLAHAQSGLDLVGLTFSPGPAVGHVIPERVGRDEDAPDESASRGMTRSFEVVRQAEEEFQREEAANGATSSGLIERLKSLAELYRELGEYPLAIVALERAAQITRANDGLYSLGQYETLDTAVDILEEVGSYYESDLRQAELLELASHNEGDPRVPSILTAVADRQMDAVMEYVATGDWERALERIDAPHGWDLQNIEVLRHSANKKPLNRLDNAILELLENGSYEIGDTLDAREVLGDTYSLIDVVNDHNEAGQRLIVDGLQIFTVELERDLALSAFRRARRLYSFALQAMLESGAHGTGEYLATEQKLLHTYYFELKHTELYPDVPAQASRSSRRRATKPVAYGAGASALEAKIVSLLSYGAPAVDIARAMMKLADWHLLFSENRTALDMYREAHDLLVREGVPTRTVDELLSPATPAILAEFTSDELVEFDRAHPYLGYVDVAVATGRYGDVKEAVVVSSSAGTATAVARRARTHVFESRFRPRFADGQPRRSDRFEVRYYYDYTERPPRPVEPGS